MPSDFHVSYDWQIENASDSGDVLVNVVRVFHMLSRYSNVLILLRVCNVFFHGLNIATDIALLRFPQPVVAS